MNDVIIRKAQENDVETIYGFICALAEYEKLSHEVSATVEDLHTSLFGGKPYAEVFIAEHQGEPAGFALYFYNYSTFLGKPGMYLEDLFVSPDFRGKGIGVGLLKRLAQEALAQGCGRLEWTVLDWNKSAIDLYQSIGAQSMDDWTINRLGGDALTKFAGTS